MSTQKQRLVWLPPQPDGPLHGRGSLIIQASGERPQALWTLAERDEANPPTLPFQPRHGYNAFSEDCGHDWQWLSGSRIRYSGNGRDRGGVWLLLVD